LWGYQFDNSMGAQFAARVGNSDPTGPIAICAGILLALVGLVLAISGEAGERAAQTSNQHTTTKLRCPKCKTPVEADTKKCPGCGGLFKAGVEAGLTEGLTKKCPDCAEEVKIDAHKCRFCGAVFPVA
jgi:RNA polymerase subunit RPABC4/transcription elongation factor Spt4